MKQRTVNAYRSVREVWVDKSPADGVLYMEMAYVLRPRWERFWRWLVRWEPCRTYWGSHGCDKRRGHFGRHRCGAILRDRCCRGYKAPPWWAPWRKDETHYFGDDVDGWPAHDNEFVPDE